MNMPSDSADLHFLLGSIQSVARAEMNMPSDNADWRFCCLPPAKPHEPESQVHICETGSVENAGRI